MCCTDSNRRTEANRRNARKSTGPRTPEGKARSSQNALVHGLRAASVLVPGENPYELVEYRMAIIRSTNPRNALEMECVELIIRAGWKLRRCQAAEVYRLQSPNTYTGLRMKPSERLAQLIVGDNPYLAELTRYELQYVRMMERAIEQLRKLKNDPVHGTLGEYAGQMLKSEEAQLSELDAAEPSNPTPEPSIAPNEAKADSPTISDSPVETSDSRSHSTDSLDDLDKVIATLEKTLAKVHGPKEGG